MEISKNDADKRRDTIKPDLERSGEDKMNAASESVNPDDVHIGETVNNLVTALDEKVGDEDQTENMKKKDGHKNSQSMKPFYTKNGMDFANRYKY